eukprot:1228215-Karenia_brevis.AAC.1
MAANQTSGIPNVHMSNVGGHAGMGMPSSSGGVQQVQMDPMLRTMFEQHNAQMQAQFAQMLSQSTQSIFGQVSSYVDARINPVEKT